MKEKIDALQGEMKEKFDSLQNDLKAILAATNNSGNAASNQAEAA